MRRFIIFLSVLILGVSCRQQDVQHNIIPAPAEISFGRGEYVLPDTVKVVCYDSSDMFVGTYLHLMFPYNHFQIDLLGSNGDIYLIGDKNLSSDSAYSLKVSKKGIEIGTLNHSRSGIIAAISTLSQLSTGSTIPYVKIKDEPRFEWRGFMLDVARHFYSKEEVKTILKLMARYKFNRFHMHLADDQGWRIEIKAYPELVEKGAFRSVETRHDSLCRERAILRKDPTYILDKNKIADGLYGGYYTQDDIREIVSFAADLGIDVIPEIDMPGHNFKVLEAFPNLSCSGEAKWGEVFSVPLCAGNDDVLTFAKNVYKEIFELFPFEYVHIGADEVEQIHWKNCPKCQKRIEELGLGDEAGLQAWFVKEMNAFFNENGKTLIGWDEIAHEAIPKNAVVMWWRGWSPEMCTKALELEHQVIVSSSEHFYLSREEDKHFVEKIYTWEPNAYAQGYEDQILGLQAHLWTELCPTFENSCYKIFPRLFAVSELAWIQPEKKDFENFKLRVLEHLWKLQSDGIHFRLPDLEGFEEENATLHFRGYTKAGLPGPIQKAVYKR